VMLSVSDWVKALADARRATAQRIKRTGFMGLWLRFRILGLLILKLITEI
jgi:hypothetical protein